MVWNDAALHPLMLLRLLAYVPARTNLRTEKTSVLPFLARHFSDRSSAFLESHACLESPRQNLIPIMLGLVRSIDGDVDVLGLLFRQLRQFDAEFV